MKYLVLGARLLIGCVFLYASIHKIIEPAQFAQDIRNYQILWPALSNIAALTLPWIEFVAGSFLILGIFTRPAAFIATGLLVVFLAALTYVYLIGLDIECGCFKSGAAGGKIGLLTLLRDTCTFLVSLFVLLCDRGDFRVSALLTPKPKQAQTI